MDWDEWIYRGFAALIVLICIGLLVFGGYGIYEGIQRSQPWQDSTGQWHTQYVCYPVRTYVNAGTAKTPIMVPVTTQDCSYE